MAALASAYNTQQPKLFGAPLGGTSRLIGTEASVPLHWCEVTADGVVDSCDGALAVGGLEKPPVLLLHGLLGSSRNFGTWARDLKKNGFIEEDRRLFMADLRNHGNSPHAPSMSYDDMAADVIALVDSIYDRAGSDVHVAATTAPAADQRQVVLVGHSMGGKVAMATAMLAPDVVGGVCVIDIAPVRYSKADGSDWRLAEQMVQQLSRLPLEDLKGDRRAADSFLAREVLDPQLRAFALMNLETVDCDKTEEGKRLRWRIGLESIVDQLNVIAGAEVGTGEIKADHHDEAPIRKQVKPYRGPVTFVKGGRSEYIKFDAAKAAAAAAGAAAAAAAVVPEVSSDNESPTDATLPLFSLSRLSLARTRDDGMPDDGMPSHAERMRSFFPRATITTVPDAGHWVHTSHPAELHSAVGSFTRAVSHHADGE